MKCPKCGAELYLTENQPAERVPTVPDPGPCPHDSADDFPPVPQSVLDSVARWLGPACVGSFQVLRCAELVRVHGEQATLYAISQAQQANTRHWSYVEAICRNQGGTQKQANKKLDREYVFGRKKRTGQ